MPLCLKQDLQQSKIKKLEGSMGVQAWKQLAMHARF